MHTLIQFFCMIMATEWYSKTKHWKFVKCWIVVNKFMIYIAAWNTATSPYFLACKFSGNSQFPKILGESPESLRKECSSKKFPHQEISSNFCILTSAWGSLLKYFAYCEVAYPEKCFGTVSFQNHIIEQKSTFRGRDHIYNLSQSIVVKFTKFSNRFFFC